LDIAALAGEFLADETELEVRIIRERVVVERDARLGFDPQTDSPRTIVVERRDLDRETLARPDQLAGGSQLDLELRRDKILDLELGLADRRGLRGEPPVRTPRAR